MEVAEVAVTALVTTLAKLLEEEIGLYRGFDAALKDFATRLESIQSDLQVAEMHQSQRTDIQKWLINLKDAAYDVQDILADADILDSQRGQKSCLCLSTPFLPRYNLAHKLQNMLKILKDRYDNKPQLPDVNGAGNRYGVTLGSRDTCSLPSVNESEFVGRDEEKGRIIEKLLDSELDQHHLSVYGIWGMGGIGKTTLAQHIFNDEKIQKHFGLLIWVCVSEDFTTKRLVGAIIQSIEGSPCHLSELDALQRKLREKLLGKKFLLVLDDVWNEDAGLWESLKAILRCESKGSLVFVTTRNENIASMMATIGVHQIGILNDEDSWSLFQQKASSTGKVDEKFVTIGMKIVGKCGGVPLAIKTLGSSMRSKTEENEWMDVEKSEFWNLKDVKKDILNVLKLSYYNLEPHMRQCFAYCCIFPKDDAMEKDQIVQLWMANDLIPSDAGDLLNTGRMIFKELVWRSFFQDIQKNWRGRTTCKMHDLMHDLATSIMRHETCSSIVKFGMKLEIPKPFRHLSCHVEGPRSHKIESRSHDSLRSILLNRNYWYNNELLELFSSLLSKQQYLRALHVSHNEMEELPSFICKFKHLKYLVMSCKGMRSLPKSFTCLLNLQTLILMNSGDLVELPNDLKVMKDLQFLEVEKNDSLRCTPPGLGDLTWLRRLSIFIVGENPSLHIDQLKGLNLEGELTIKGLDNVRNLEDAKSSYLVGKRNLTCLKLYWTDTDKNESPQHYEEVLEGLQPHHGNLQELHIYAYHGSKFPNWTWSSTFEHLNEIRLEKCERCEELPPLGSLPSLTTLILESINSVRHLGKEWLADGGRPFPSLTTLYIRKMSKLEEWSIPDSLECFPCLTSLWISKCPKLNKFPFLPTLKVLGIDDESNATLLTSIKNLTSLEECYLSCSNEVDVFPDDMLQNCKALEMLRIEAGGVRSVSNMLHNVSSLKDLDFLCCSKLEGFPEGGYCLHSLERLSFGYCDRLATFPAIILEGLPSLKSLTFWKCKELMEPLSGCLTQVSPLNSLKLGIPKLQQLPESLQKLTSLTELELDGCRELLSFPEWFGCLESLIKLRIWKCPELEKICKKAEGEDWEKISHIPIITVDLEVIQWDWDLW